MNKTLINVLYIFFLIVWSFGNFIHTYFYYFPWLDSWCYIAPVLASKAPFQFIGPLVGDFLNFDKIWAIYPPGFQSLMTFSTLLFEKSSFVIGLTYCIFWLLLSLYIFCLTFELTKSQIFAFFSSFLVLSDRTIFSNIAMSRPEAIASFFLIVFSYELYKTITNNQKFYRIIFLTIISIFLTIIHPLTVILSNLILAILSVVLIVTFFKEKKLNWKLVMPCAGILIGNFILLIFFSQNYAWEQFRIHASAHQYPFGWGTRILGNLQYNYPFFTGFVFYLIALITSFYLLIISIKNKQKSNILLFGGSLLILIYSLFFHEKYDNDFYFSISIPIAIVIFTYALSIFYSRIQLNHLSQIVFFCFLLLFSAAQSVWYFTRLHKYVISGLPNIRQELKAILDTFPHEQTILIPEKFWEAGLHFQGTVYMLYLPMNAGPKVREQYERYIFNKLKIGDFIILDKFCEKFSHESSLKRIYSEEFQLVKKISRLFPGRHKWGYDLEVYQKIK